MTVNRKPGTLPDRFSEQLQNNPQIAQLVADNRLARFHLLDRVEDLTGLDLDRTSEGHLSHDGLATLFKHVTADGRTLRRIQRDMGKTGLAQRVGDALDAGIDVASHQKGFRKDQLIRVWFRLRPEAPELNGAQPATSDHRGERRVAVPDGGE